MSHLKQVIHANPINNQFLLSNLPFASISLKKLNKVAPIKYLLDFNRNKLSLEPSKEEPLALTMREHCIRLDLANLKETIETFEGYIMKRNKWGLVVGSIGLGKTEVAKCLASKMGMKIVDWEVLGNQLKEKLGGDEGPLEELQFKDYVNHLQEEFCKGQWVMDGWNFSED